jgi:hypothetical protein
VISAPLPAECNVVELRRYTLHPGRRDELIELFEREFVASQEEAGICLLGRFRDNAADDQFVWLRGFRSMEERFVALSTFYAGPAWAQHRDAANATMIDSDDVLLLQPTFRAAGRPVDDEPVVLVTIADVSAVPAGDRAAVLPPAARTLARFESLHVQNDFPRLPVRDADVVVSITDNDAKPAAGNGVVQATLIRTR